MTYLHVSSMLLLIIFACRDAGAGDCDTKGTANGCSVPGNLKMFYKRKFTPSCNMHDHCYNCGEVKNLSRYYCDVKFYWDMVRTCNREWWWWEKYSCRKVALGYYFAVRGAGWRFWMKKSKGYCNQSWVLQCIY